MNLYRALTRSADRMLYMGNRYRGHGRPGGTYSATVDAWFDHYLKGVPNGAERLPDVTSEMSDYDGPIGWWSGAWPKTKDVTLVAQHVADPTYGWKLLPEEPRRAAPKPVASFTTTATNTEAGANTNPRANTQWFWFETPLASDVRIFGNVSVRLWSTVHREWVTYTPTIVDVDPLHRISGPGQLIATDERGLISATRGWLDSRYRRSLSSPVTVTPGTSFGMTIVEKPQDYTFRKGHLIGLSVQTEIAEWNVPKPYPGCTSIVCSTVRIDWSAGQTTVTLPVVGAPRRAGELFGS